MSGKSKSMSKQAKGTKAARMTRVRVTVPRAVARAVRRAARELGVSQAEVGRMACRALLAAEGVR